MRQNLQPCTNQRLLSVAVIVLLSLSAIQLSAQVSGTVWQDLPVNGTTLNTYGVKDANELGVEGVTVTVFPGGMSAMTDVNGDYTIAAAAGAVRVEFTWPMSWLKSSTDGGGVNTSVQFVTAPNATVNFGLHDPADFSDTANPSTGIPAWIAGTGVGSTEPALYSFGYNSTNQNPTDGFNGNNPGTTPVVDATTGEVGTTWGIAYQKTEKRYFAATVLRRHSGMINSPGSIYVIDKSAAMGSLVHSFDLNGILTANGGTIDVGAVCRGGGCENDLGNTGVTLDYTLDVDPAVPTVDLDAADKVGKIAFGDADMEPGTSNLWVVNLNQKALIKVDVSDAIAANLPGTVDQYLITTLPGLPSCTNGEIRPWGLHFTHGKGYLGLVCDATAGGTAADLQGFVVSFDPNNVAAGFTQEISFPLNFSRGAPETIFAPWSSNWADFRTYPGARRCLPQPIVSDIGFDEQGNMNIAILDRGGMQLGGENYTIESGSSTLVDGQVMGDIFRACKVPTGYEMESYGACPVNFGADGFQGTGEFYNDTAGDGTPESSNGSLQTLKGSGEMILSVLDPNPTGAFSFDFIISQGVNFFDINTGAITDYYGIDHSGAPGEMAKASGMGDIELFLAPAPIEIGNLVWDDANGNGEQDADESGIANVTVELYNAAGTTLLATAVTDANGNYIFSNDPNGTAFVAGASHVYQLAALKPNTAYVLKVPITNGGNNLTTANGAGGKDSIDSDANTGTGEATVLATDILVLGANNHTFDFGYSAVPPCPPTRCGTISGVKN